MGWGGHREGAGRKPNRRKKSPKPAAEPTKAKPSTPLSRSDMQALLEASNRRAVARVRTQDWCPFVIREDKFCPEPWRPRKALQLAQDTALVQTSGWATNAWMAGGLLSSVASEGLLFLGYPYLSELAQRPEYRTPAEIIATEATRKWIRFKASGDVDKGEKIRELEDFLVDLKVRDRFCDVALYDGLMGRSHLFLELKGADDAELKTPIGNGRDAISKSKLTRGCLQAIRNIEPLWTYPTTYNASNPLMADWYNPQVWYVMGREIHRTRLPTFIGRPIPDLLKPAYSFGGLSLSQILQPYVEIWLSTRQSVADLIRSFSVFVLLTDMAQRLQNGGGMSDLMTRVAMFNAFRDNQGAFVLDKATEEFKNVSASLAGLSELQAQSQEHMMSVARIPAVKFTGLQPLGLNASSEGEMRAFYDTIHAYQPKLMGPNLDFVIDVAMISLWGERDEDITYEWVPLWSLSEKEEAELRKAEAETAQIHIDTGVISQEEERARIANDPRTMYPGLDPNDMPDLLEEEEEGLQPKGGNEPGGIGEGGEEDGDEPKDE